MEAHVLRCVWSWSWRGQGHGPRRKDWGHEKIVGALCKAHFTHGFYYVDLVYYMGHTVPKYLQELYPRILPAATKKKKKS